MTLVELSSRVPRLLCVAGLGLLAVMISAPSLLAQVTKIDGAVVFEDSIHLSFQEFAGTQPLRMDEDIYSGLGLTLQSTGSGGLSPFVALIGWGITNYVDATLRNSSASGSSANEALAMRFQHPVSRVGVRLGNGTAQTTATLRVYGVNGDLLGSVERTGAVTPTSIRSLEDIPFLGLESVSPVATVVLDYGAEPAGEQIHDLFFEYSGNRSFVVYVPQIADGQAGDATVRTTLQVQNPYQVPVTVRIDFFAEGEPLDLVIGNETLSSLSFELPVRGSRQIETSGNTSPLALGFARVESRLPVKAQALFRVNREGEAVQESGFQSTTPRLYQILAGEMNRETGLDTGIAVANENEFPVKVSLNLASPTGQAGGPFGLVGEYTVPPKSQRAFFATEAFGYLREVQAFTGSVVVYSTGGGGAQTLPVAVSGLRTIHGVAVSSIPAVGTNE